MNKRDVSELKRRFKKDAETFTRIACCYVNAEKQKITSFEENFSSLEEDEYCKYVNYSAIE